LLRVLQVKQCETKINKTLQYYLTNRKCHTRVAENIKNAPRTPREHQDILQSFTLLLQERLPNGIKITKEK
jgi:hypothetical protein